MPEWLKIWLIIVAGSIACVYLIIPIALIGLTLLMHTEYQPYVSIGLILVTMLIVRHMHLGD